MNSFMENQELKYKLLKEIKGHWHLLQGLKSYLKVYCIIYWHPEYLRNELTDNGTLIKDGIEYTVLYHDNGSPAQYRANCNQVALSFRCAVINDNQHAYVLIKGVK